MQSISLKLLKQVCPHQNGLVKSFSAEAAVQLKRPVALRTSADPLSHTEEHIGHFYTIPDNDVKGFFALGGLTKTYQKNAKTFAESAIMVRPHTVELLSYLKKANYSHPVIRYVLYGKPGCGKSTTLSHVLHYAYLSDFVVVHIPWVWNWYRRNRIEAVSSETKEGLVNLPIEAANWLKYFEKQNEKILPKLDLRLTKEYVWSTRETSPAETPLIELIKHGISRIKYACDVIDVLISELKVQSSDGKCKTMIAIDGFNSFFLPFSNIKKEDKTRVIPDQVSLAQTFFKAVQADWSNGAVVLTVDEIPIREEDPSEKPLYLLKKRGFEVIDPFIPVEVPVLSEFEFHSLLDYYEDRRWLQKQGAREELEFISRRNPFWVMNLCAPL